MRWWMRTRPRSHRSGPNHPAPEQINRTSAANASRFISERVATEIAAHKQATNTIKVMK